MMSRDIGHTQYLPIVVYIVVTRDGKNPKNPKYIAMVFGFYCGFWCFTEVFMVFVVFGVFHKKLKVIKSFYTF